MLRLSFSVSFHLLGSVGTLLEREPMDGLVKRVDTRPASNKWGLHTYGAGVLLLYPTGHSCPHHAELIHCQLVEVDGVLASLFSVLDTGVKAISVPQLCDGREENDPQNR